MIQGLVGKKLGMTQIFDETGVAHPVTVIEVRALRGDADQDAREGRL